MTTKILIWVVVILGLSLGGLYLYHGKTVANYETDIAMKDSEIRAEKIMKDMWKAHAEGLSDWIDKQDEIDKIKAADEALNQAKIDLIEKTLSDYEDKESSEVLKATIDGLQKGAQ